MKGYITILFLTVTVTQVVIEGGMVISVQKDGAAFTYHCESESSRPKIIWSLKMTERSETIASCHPSSQCSDYFPSYFNASVRQERGLIISDLTIHSHNDTMIRLECSDFQSYITIWTFNIFTMPNMIQCFAPTIEGDVIKVMCAATSEVHPSPICKFDYMPTDQPLNYTVEFTQYRVFHGLCILVGRPSSSMYFPTTEYRFKAHMIPDVYEGYDYTADIVSSDWSPSITVETLTLTGNGKRGSVVVDEGQNVLLECGAPSGPPYYTLRLLYRYGVVAEKSSRYLLAYRISVNSVVHIDVYLCQAESASNVLGDSIKVYVKRPLRLKYSYENNTEYDAPLTPLRYMVRGYPAPMKNFVRLFSREVDGYNPVWQNSSDFVISWNENFTDTYPYYQLNLMPTVFFRGSITHATRYLIEISNGLEPTLKISFTIWTGPLTEETTTSVSTTTTITVYRSRLSSGISILGPILGVSIPVAILLAVIIYCCCNKKARARRCEQRRHTTARSSSSAPSPSGSPWTSFSQLYGDPVPHVANRNSSNGNLLYNHRPSSGFTTLTNDRNGVRFADGRSRQTLAVHQLDAPPSYEIAALTNCSHGSTGAMDAQAQSDPHRHNQQYPVQPPSYDSVRKPEDPPPPYPGN